MAKARLVDALSGYHCDAQGAQEAIDQLIGSLFNPLLPQLEVTEALSVMGESFFMPCIVAHQNRTFRPLCRNSFTQYFTRTP